MSKSESVSATEKIQENSKKIEEEIQKKKNKSVPFLKLFKFADIRDWQLMIVGSIGACVHGGSLPVFFIFFGKMIDVLGLAYLYPAAASHKVAKVYTPNFLSIPIQIVKYCEYQNDIVLYILLLTMSIIE